MLDEMWLKLNYRFRVFACGIFGWMALMGDWSLRYVDAFSCLMAYSCLSPRWVSILSLFSRDAALLFGFHRCSISSASFAFSILWFTASFRFSWVSFCYLLYSMFFNASLFSLLKKVFACSLCGMPIFLFPSVGRWPALGGRKYGLGWNV